MSRRLPMTSNLSVASKKRVNTYFAEALGSLRLCKASRELSSALNDVSTKFRSSSGDVIASVMLKAARLRKGLKLLF